MSKTGRGTTRSAFPDPVIVGFLIGISRSWELADGASIRIAYEVEALRKRKSR